MMVVVGTMMVDVGIVGMAVETIVGSVEGEETDAVVGVC